MNNIERGKRGEYAALEYLLKQGYVYRDRNFRAAKCEIDLIVMDGDTLVFVDEHYFCTLFKEKCGMTPGQYRLKTNGK